MFENLIAYALGQVVLKGDRFCYRDLVPLSNVSHPTHNTFK
jgi:hypothetical protein